MRSVSRKTFLNTALFTFVGFYFSFCKSKNRAKYLYFSESEIKIMENWTETILPESTMNMPNAEQAEVIRRLDEEFYFVSEDIQDEFHSAILVLNFLPLFFGHWSRFENLSLASRKRFLAESSETNSDIVRAVIGNLKLVTFLAYYGHKSTWASIGYEGPFGNPPEKWSESRIYYKANTGEKT